MIFKNIEKTQIVEQYICYENKKLYIFSCFFHKFCINCYMKINLCALCKLPKILIE